MTSSPDRNDAAPENVPRSTAPLDSMSLHVVCNAGSGSGDAREAKQQIEQTLASAGRRRRSVALWAGLTTLLREHRPLVVELEHDAGMLGQLGEDESVREFAFRSMSVRPLSRTPRRGIKVAVDGEIFWSQPPLRFSVAPQPLMLMVPARPLPSA